MKLLVFCLYFANSEGTEPAFMRILSYIEFYKQWHGIWKKKKKRKKIFLFLFFFLKIIWSEMTHQDDSNVKIVYKF